MHPVKCKNLKIYNSVSFLKYVHLCNPHLAQAPQKARLCRLPISDPQQERKEMLVDQSCPTLCDPMDPTRLLCPWDSPGKNTGVGCHSLLQGIFQTQGSNPSLPHCRQILYHLSHQGRPCLPTKVAGVQPRLIQGIRSGDGISEDQDTIASIRY